ncbi:tRNA-dihydrouridine synthase [Bacillus licheniformis]|nr:tRNA-dihydrouridine synthase [Bacillus licheniformis]
MLAPMAGVCNSAFRLTVKEFGAGLVCAEMVSDKAILYNNAKRWECFISMNVKTAQPADLRRRKETLVEAAKFVDQTQLRILLI